MLSMILRVGRAPFMALLDSGSIAYLTQISVLPPGQLHSGMLSVTCVQGDVREALEVEVRLGLGEGEW